MINFQFETIYKDNYLKGKSTNIPLWRLSGYPTNVHRIKFHWNQARFQVKPIIQPAVYNSPNYTQSLLLQGCFFLFANNTLLQGSYWLQNRSPSTSSAESKPPLLGFSQVPSGSNRQRNKLQGQLPLYFEGRTSQMEQKELDSPLLWIKEPLLTSQIFENKYTHLLAGSSKMAIFYLLPKNQPHTHQKEWFKDNLKKEQKTKQARNYT